MDTDPKQNYRRRIHDIYKKLYTMPVAVLIFIVVIITVSAVVLSLASAFGQVVSDVPEPQRVVFEALALCIPPILFGLLIIILRIVFHRWI